MAYASFTSRTASFILRVTKHITNSTPRVVSVGYRSVMFFSVVSPQLLCSNSSLDS